jgi:hypothetical protein
MSNTCTPPKTRTSAVARALALACFCAFALAACSERAPSPAEATTAAQTVCADARVRWLVESGGKNEPFLRDTTDALGLLVARLAGRQQDPLTRAKEELVALGEPALPALERFVAAQMTEPNGGPRLLNALAVVSQLETPRVRPLLLRALEHPQESVRIAALKGLVRHPDAADYDHLAALLQVSSPDTQGLLAQALLASDRAHAERDFCRWFAAREHPATWQAFVTAIASTTRPETVACLPALVPLANTELQHYLRAALARNGDAEALAAERELLRNGSPPQRQSALLAFDAAGATGEFVYTLTTDTELKIRELAADRIASAPDAPELRAALARGLSDTAREVRKVCLVELAQRGDATARDMALELLKGDKIDVEDALAALRGPWSSDPALAERGFVILRGLWHGETGTPRVERRTLARALALVPLRAAAEELYAAAAQETEPISQLTPHHWYTQQIGNGGASGAEFLRERWRAETNPLRRLDLAAGAIYERDATAREFLAGALEDPRTTPCEGLWIAEQLAQRSPTAELAPLLKRYTLTVADPVVRPALNGLLWRWYGGADS